MTSTGDIWVYDLERGAMSRVTFEASNEIDPLWSPDGEYVTYSAVEPGQPSTVFLRRADGTGAAQKLITAEQGESLIPFSWHPEGRALALIRRQLGVAAVASDVVIAEFSGDHRTRMKVREMVAFASSPFTDSEPAFSPDGKWLAYQSNETGRNEIYVSGYPGPSGRWQVSTAGGMFPTWGHDGRTLYFKTLDQQIMAITYSSARGAFEASAPRLWSATRLDDLGLVVRSFDVHPDGRMLVLRAPDDERSNTVKFTLIPDFLAELRRLAPVTK
jgi:Tol biopolymer transport system component